MADRHVYVRHPDYAWVPGLLVEQNETTAKVLIEKHEDEDAITGFFSISFNPATEETVTVQLKDYANNELPLQNDFALAGSGQIEDMVSLSFLNEAAILYNLKLRHRHYLPYTRASDILIAVNPYKWFYRLYSEDRQSHYSNFLVWSPPTGRDPRQGLPPHVYETSALAFRGMAFDVQHQSILVSGESGAGKTETVKICMDHLASMVKQNRDKKGSSSLTKEKSSRSLSTQDQQVVKRVLDSNPLLESFGNAKTRRNDNSSRFGKYIELQFKRMNRYNTTQFSLAGSECRVYLLEKNRVVRHEEESERNFHIFYQILAAPDHVKQQIWDGLQRPPNSFRYIGESDHAATIEGVSDADQFLKTTKSLLTVGITDSTLKYLMRSICIVLQLGNLVFTADPADADRSLVSSVEELAELTKLMGIQDTAKFQTALLKRKVSIRGEEMMVPLNAEEAKDSADALAKHIYECIFLWLVRRINMATAAVEANDQIPFSRHSTFGKIGLLDIFGFESFPVNTFEQLCINFANERLQAKFTRDIFSSVFEEYKSEGIALREINYDDNTHVLDLIENPTGLLQMLNEECIRPSGSDTGFVHKALYANATSAALIVPRIIHEGLDFGIRHYAGDVMYNAKGFLAKNQDRLPSDLMEAAQLTSNKIISKELARRDGSREYETKPGSSAGGPGSAAGPKKSNLVALTVWTKYKNQLHHLMEDLKKSKSLYVRCIKPNTVKKPKKMEHAMTVAQLQSCGVVSALTLARSAFPNRLDHQYILERFYLLLPKHTSKVENDSSNQDGKSPSDLQREKCEALLAHAFRHRFILEKDKSKNDPSAYFVLGKSRAYFRAGAFEYLEAARLRAMEQPAIRIQTTLRRILAKKKVTAMRKVAALKKWEQERELNESAMKIQCMVRCHLAKSIYRKKHMKFLKDRAKALKKEKKARKKNKAATVIQKYVRRRLVQRQFQPVFVKMDEREILQQRIRKLREEVGKAELARKQELEQLQNGMETESAVKKAWEESMNAAAEEVAKGEVDKVIDFLQAEHKKLQLKTKLLEGTAKPLKKNLDKLMEENAVLRKEFDEVHKKNQLVKQETDALIRKRQETERKTTELRQELRNISKGFMPVAHGRLDFQTALAEMMVLLEKKCKDDQLYEDITLLVYDTQTKAKGLHATAMASQEMLLKEQVEILKRRQEAGASVDLRRASTWNIPKSGDNNREESKKGRRSMPITNSPVTPSGPKSPVSRSRHSSPRTSPKVNGKKARRAPASTGQRKSKLNSKSIAYLTPQAGKKGSIPSLPFATGLPLVEDSPGGNKKISKPSSARESKSGKLVSKTPTDGAPKKPSSKRSKRGSKSPKRSQSTPANAASITTEPHASK